MPVSNDFQTLLTFAEAYFHLGYSVIPLIGDADASRAKVPAIPWANFQHLRASCRDHQQWFKPAGFSGLGLVTGHISQLVVLDFDSEIVFNQFKALYADLLETHTVRSARRGLPHLYFRLPPYLHIPSLKGQGVDLLSEGRYVVAPPTSLNGQTYRILRGGMPKTLTERDIRRLKAFLTAHQVASPDSGLAIPSTTQPINPTSQPREQDLQAIYRHLVISRGRNEALFQTCLFARDQHLPLAFVQQALVALHTQQKNASGQPVESPAQRQREALSTIRSAFSRPPRVTQPRAAHQPGRIANSIREAFLRHRQTHVLRTYEGLLQAGIRPGQYFSAGVAVARLKGLVGRDSVLAALKAGQGRGQFFLPPQSPPNAANAVAKDFSDSKSKKCSLIAGKIQEKPLGGRPNRLYRMPTSAQLCRLLGVKPSASDRLEPHDLASAHQIRMALHREFLKRRPGSYPKRWLAARLGVSSRTLFSYNQRLHVHSRPGFLVTVIDWQTIERLPLDEALQGAYLITLQGKKYPALRQIASRLLARGESLSLKQQTVNYYWYGEVEPAPAAWVPPACPPPQADPTVMQPALPAPPLTQSHWSAVPPPLASPPADIRPKQATTVSDYKKPLENSAQEALARQLYDLLNHMGGSEFKKLNRAGARRLVVTYEPTLIRAALDTLKRRAANGTLRNPVGFFITLLRSAGRNSQTRSFI